MLLVGNKKFGVILGYVSMIITNLASFLITPMLLQLGTSQYGVYKSVLVIYGFFALGDMGMTNAMVRFMSEYRAVDDKLSQRKFMAVGMLFEMLTSFIILLFGFILVYTSDTLFGIKFTAEELQLFCKLLIIITVSSCFNMFISLFNSILKAFEEYSFIRIINIVKTFIRFGLIALFLYLGYDITSVVLIDLCINFMCVIVQLYVILFRYKLYPKIKGITKEFIKDIFGFSLWVFIDAIAFQIFYMAGPILMKDSNDMAIFDIGKTIFTLFFSFSLVIGEVLMPEIMAKVARHCSSEEMSDYIIKIGRIKWIFMLLPLIGFIALGQEFIGLWVGDGFNDAYFIAMLIIVPQAISGTISDTGQNIMWAQRKHKMKSILSICFAVIFVVSVYFLQNFLGIYTPAVVTCFIYLVGYGIVYNIYFAKVLKLNIKKSLIKIFPKSILSIALIAPVAFAVTLIPIKSWLVFIAQAIIICIWYCLVIWFTYLNRYEKTMVKNLIRKILPFKKKRTKEVKFVKEDTVNNGEEQLKELDDDFKDSI